MGDNYLFSYFWPIRSTYEALSFQNDTVYLKRGLQMGRRNSWEFQHTQMIDLASFIFWSSCRPLIQARLIYVEERSAYLRDSYF